MVIRIGLVGASNALGDCIGGPPGETVDAEEGSDETILRRAGASNSASPSVEFGSGIERPPLPVPDRDVNLCDDPQ